ncbi:MAG: DUF4350 domain-containing protein [Gemmatimonadetes bacterium]|nr:DUF4350 domain-containing protein [Gemmatimonadota bacterium]MYB99650.1 DUF4350 domain-containing protein [Gemmatimonadota bacterium]MYI44922.1 DUF4350 domain-containing protein [Gemmatimonadota bacterium]
MSDSGTGGATTRRRTLIWICATVVGAALAGYLTRPEGRRSTGVLRSSLRTTPDGVAALSRGIARMGRHTEPRLTPMMDADPVRGTIVQLQPVAPTTPREIEALLDHVRGGGTLLYAPSRDRLLGIPRTSMLMVALGVWFDGFLARELPDSVAATWGEHPLAEGLPPPERPRFGFEVIRREGADSAGIDDGSAPADSVAANADRADEEAGREPEESAEPDQESDSIPELPEWFPDAGDAEDPVPLLTAPDSAGKEVMAAALVRMGEGRILIFADARHLSNGAADEDPMAVLAVRAALAYTSEADTVFFDEFHQGITGYGSRAEVLANFFLGSPGGLTLLHVVLVSFLFLACKGLRFGLPATAVAPADRERRSPLEHVSALGDLYAKAGAAKTAALLLLARLARAVRASPPRDLEEADRLLREIETRRGRHRSINRVREGLDAEPADLTLIASGVDEQLARRFSK